MRIDGRFDSESWIQPRAKDAVESAKVNDSHQERREALSASTTCDTGTDFTLEVQRSHAFTRASRMAEAVADMLAATPDL